MGIRQHGKGSWLPRGSALPFYIGSCAQPVRSSRQIHYIKIKNSVNLVRIRASSLHFRCRRGKLTLKIADMVVNMRKNNKKKPIAPIYGFGLVWLVYSIFFDLFSFGGFIRCVVLAAAVYMLLKSIGKTDKSAQEDPEPPKAEKAPEPKKQPEAPKEPEPEKSTGNPELDAVIRQGRGYVRRIQELNDDIPDYKISAQLKQIEILTASIIDQVEKKEAKLKQVRQFMNYYLPTTIKLLEQYVQLQNVGLKGENIENGMKQIEDMLDKVILAFQKQLDDLFERDVVDITAEIQVMERMMASQGLTGQKDFNKE